MKFEPHPYQKYCIDYLLARPAAGLFLDMGLGKTVITLTAIDRLIYDRFEVSKVLVIAPLRVAEDTWTRESTKWDHLKHLRVSRVLGTEKQRTKALEQEADIYCINRENVQWIVKHYGLAWPFDMVVIDMHYDAARRVLYIFGELTKYKMGNRETADALFAFGLTGADRITADSAEPKSINDYKDYGLFCKGAIKGPGSVDYSHKWLQALTKIVIDPVRCPDTYKEFTEYEHETGPDGVVIEGYPDANNHHIDAVRYGLEPVWKRRGQ